MINLLGKNIAAKGSLMSGEDRNLACEAANLLLVRSHDDFKVDLLNAKIRSIRYEYLNKNRLKNKLDNKGE